MAYAEHNGLLVPRGYVDETRRRMAVQAHDGSSSSIDQIVKSVFGGLLPKSTPRKWSPKLDDLNLYDGIADPFWQSQATDVFLRTMSRTPIMRMAIDTMVHQITPFSRRAYTRDQQGWKIRLCDRDAKPDAADLKAMDEIGGVLEDCGTTQPRKTDGHIAVYSGDQLEEADNLCVFLQKMMRDSLAMDWACFRMEEGINPKRRPVAFWKALDASRVRRVLQKPKQPLIDAWGNVTDYGYDPQLRKGTRIEFVETSKQRLVQYEYMAKEVAAWVRNPMTDEENLGYGWPESMSLIEVVAGYMVAVSHNVQYFTHQKVPPGIVTVAGKYDEEQVYDFLQNIVAPGTDGAQAYKLPFLFGQEGMTVDYKPFRNAEREDMLWRNWIVFLINMTFGMFHIAAEEGNFQAFLTVGGQQTGTGGDQRVANMRWTGLRTNAGKLQDLLNRHIISRWHADSTGRGPYEIEFCNVIPRDEQKEREADQLDLNAGLATINEIRGRRDQPILRDAKDRELWKKVVERGKKLYSDMAKRYEDRFLMLCQAAYEAAGGDWCLWTDCPVNSTLNYMYQQEHQDVISPQEDPGEAWQQSQNGGPPQQFMQNVDAQAYKAAMEKQQQANPPRGDDESPSGEPGGSDEQKGFLKSLGTRLRDGLRAIADRVYYVVRPGRRP